MSRRLSVLYFTNTLARGGAEEHILTLIRGLDRERFQPSLVCTPVVAAQLGPDLPGDVELCALSLRTPKELGAARQLAQRLRARRIDILHSHLFYSSLFASPIGWLRRVPVIVETPHLREHWRHGVVKGRFIVDRLVGRFVDRYIAVSEANARYLVECKGLPARKIVRIHNGCEVERFDPQHPAPTTLRPRLGFGAEDPVLVVLARLEPQKGHQVLLQALPQVVRRFPRARVVCVGEGSLRGALEAQGAALGLSDTVRFVGYQADVRDWLALADLTVLPSLYEGLPLVAIESLAAGRPVVATDVDGTPEVIVDGHTGLTVPPADAPRLAEAICRLLADAEERGRLGRQGRQWVAEHFTHRRQIRETEAVYLQAVSERGLVTGLPAGAPAAR